MGITDKEFRECTFTGILEEDVKLMKEILGDDDTVIFRPFENINDRKIVEQVIKNLKN